MIQMLLCLTLIQIQYTIGLTFRYWLISNGWMVWESEEARREASWIGFGAKQRERRERWRIEDMKAEAIIDRV